jgi:RNase adaptor protein for sRNA GlmZ degradation
MKQLIEQNLKVKIQILDAEDNTLISSVASHQQIHDLDIYHSISGVDQIYRMLLDELQNKQQSNI